MMKTRYLFWGLMALLTCVACSDDDEQQQNLPVLDTNELHLEAVGGTREVKVAVASSWTATASEPWIQISPAQGTGAQTCTVKVDSTLLANEQRKGSIRFVTREDAEVRTVNVVQEGFEKALTLSTTQVALENYADYGKRYFDVEVTSNVPFHVVIPEEAASWLSVDKFRFVLDRGARPRKATVRFNWEGNTEDSVREADIRFEVDDEDMVRLDHLAVTQERAPEITPDQRGDSLVLVICERKLNCWNTSWDKSEPIRNWNGVKLWEEYDKGVTPEMIGRVRAVEFSQCITKEGIPDELAHLTYVETLSLFSNGNKFMWSFDGGQAIPQLTNLKHLRIYAFGLTTLPEEWKNLKNLVTLDLSSNNFHTLPEVLTPENFPNLRHLSLSTNTRWAHSADLTLDTHEKSQWGGFYGSNDNNKSLLKRLFSWSNLESLLIANNLIKGQLPGDYDFPDLPKWTEEEVMANDTLATAWPVLRNKPKVLPNCKDLRINLNYLRGSLPNWLLYHPRLTRWAPETLIYNQNRGVDDDGQMAGFTNVPTSYDLYYRYYPLLKPKM